MMIKRQNKTCILFLFGTIHFKHEMYFLVIKQAKIEMKKKTEPIVIQILANCWKFLNFGGKFY